MKKIHLVIILLISVSVLLGLYFLYKTNVKSSPSQNAQVYETEEACEEATGLPCEFQTCGYIPDGKSLAEVCGKHFNKGWVVSDPYRADKDEQKECVVDCLQLIDLDPEEASQYCIEKCS